MPRPGVLDIQPYVPGKSSAPGVAKVYKLSSNETPLGPSPQRDRGLQERRRRISKIIRTARRRELREAIGRAFGLDPDRIVCGAGSDDLLNLLARAYLADGDEAIHTTHGFLVYPIATLGERRQAGGRAGDRTSPPTSMRSSRAVTARTKIVFLANPNNPTGTYMPFDEVKRLHAGLPPHVLLVLDAAYAEYVRATTTRSGIELVATSGKRRDDAAPFRRSTASRRCGSAGCSARPMSSTRSTASAGRSTSTPPAIAAGVAAIEDTGASGARRATHNTRNGSPG